MDPAIAGGSGDHGGPRLLKEVVAVRWLVGHAGPPAKGVEAPGSDDIVARIRHKMRGR
jgi:hypothetical protein